MSLCEAEGISRLWNGKAFTVLEGHNLGVDYSDDRKIPRHWAQQYLFLSKKEINPE